MSTVAAPEDVHDAEAARLVHWHEEMMAKIGVPEQHATLLAFEGVDWHDAWELLQKGCPADLVYDILR